MLRPCSMSDSLTRRAPVATGKVPFPRVFWVAIGLEVLERMAFYGVYINLTVYLGQSVGLSDKETGGLMGVFALTRSWIPVLTGALSDKLGFRRSLMLSFTLYVAAYLSLFAFQSRVGAWSAVMAMAVAGAFLKPVIPGTVRRYAPKGRETQGFSIFYASVNAGSVVGKIATKIVRSLISLRASMVNSVIGSLVGLLVAYLAFFEPGKDKSRAEQKHAEANATSAKPETSPSQAAPAAFFPTVLGAVTEVRLIGFLVLVSGYYLLIEQFYQTFPVYIVRMFGEKAPREEITLINPLAIAILQVLMGRLTKKLPALPAMAFGIFVGSMSMALMGAIPTLWGAAGSFFVFALAEMIFSPRYYEYVSSFAPKGREGLYMGFALIPFGLGGLVGGVLSGRLISEYLPKGGVLRPLPIWGTYAAIGVGCSAALAVFAMVFRPRPVLEAKEDAEKNE
jgi:proton-dependent oligopeptide transporter, POT family